MNQYRKMLERMPPRTRKIVIGVVGGIVLTAGVIMVPYPGPGWLVVFMGLAILSQEFAWAGRALDFGRVKYDAWNAWIARQSSFVKSLTFIATALVVIATIWLLNGYGLLDQWLHLNQSWLRSPLL